MAHHPLKPILYLGVIFLVFSVACGGGKSGVLPTRVPSQTENVITPASPSSETSIPGEDSLLVTSLSNLKKAVIQIEAEGTFVDPEFGWNINGEKMGSGVIIDPSGIAITNNHTVTGGAILRVWIGGDKSKTYNAVVLGVSECSDLAVIDIDGSGFKYVKWFDGDIEVGQEIYAAGFPLGDPQFTLTDGIVSKSAASGETSWASVDTVLEHTAKISPGNSGGPLVDAKGTLIGINYAVASETDQYFAISRDDALPIINQLRQGQNVDSIGINGSAIAGTINEVPVSGVWVRSVASGSPASKAGIQPGDIINQLENEFLAVDGTMADYCDVLRSRDDADIMAVSVIRWNDLSMWEGQVNGAAVKWAGYLNQNVTAIPGSSEAGGKTANCEPSGTAGFLSCQDNTGILLIDVPEDWLDFDGSGWIYDGKTIGVALKASTDLELYSWNKSTPGLFFGASDTFAQWGGYIEFLDIYTPWYREACDFDGRFPYQDGLYKGKIDYFSNCGGLGGGSAFVLAAVPIDAPASAMIIISVQLPPGQEATLKHIWNTFYVGDL